MWQKIKNNYKVTSVFILITAIIASIAFFVLYKANSQYFYDADSYYHVKIVKLMIENGLIINKFPYLQFSILKDNFVDWHYLYHLVLIPFVTIFGEFTGPKVLGSLLLGSTFGLIFLIFKELKLRYSYLYALALFFLMPSYFMYRILLIRAPIISLFLMILTLYLFIKKRPIGVAIVLFLYVWTYNMMSFLALMIFFAYLLIMILRKEKIDKKMLIIPLIGFVAGFIINPFFPHNFYYLYVFFNASTNDRWYAGMELLPPNTWDWFYGACMVVSLFLGGLVLTLIRGIKQNMINLVLIMFSIFLIIMNWRSTRFIELSAVIVGITGIVLVAPYFEDVLSKVKRNWKKMETWVVIILLAVFVQEGIFHGIWEYGTLKNTLVNSSGKNTNNFNQASGFLNQNSQKGDIVFASWDAFPKFFYYSDKNYYIVGMDPVFLELYNRGLFEEYINITLNSQYEVDLAVIKNDFHAQWILLNASQDPLKVKLEKRPELFKKELENKAFTIFRVL